MKIGQQPKVLVGMHRRLEVWRPLRNIPQDERAAFTGRTRLFLYRSWLGRLLCRKIPKVLLVVDKKLIDWEYLVVNAGLDALCRQAFDSSGSRSAVFIYVALWLVFFLIAPILRFDSMGRDSSKSWNTSLFFCVVSCCSPF